MKRRNFVQGLALGAGVGTLGAMGAYSYSPARTAFLPDIKRGTADIGLCKSVKITNISETSWFDNSIFMQDVTASGGLLVDQYTYNWAPFGNGKGPGKGTYEDGMKNIGPYLPKNLEKAWEITRELSEPTPASLKSKLWTARKRSTCLTAAGTTCGWINASSAKASTKCSPTVR